MQDILRYIVYPVVVLVAYALCAAAWRFVKARRAVIARLSPVDANDVISRVTVSGVPREIAVWTAVTFSNPSSIHKVVTEPRLAVSNQSELPWSLRIEQWRFEKGWAWQHQIVSQLPLKPGESKIAYALLIMGQTFKDGVDARLRRKQFREGLEEMPRIVVNLSYKSVSSGRESRIELTRSYSLGETIRGLLSSSRDSG